MINSLRTCLNKKRYGSWREAEEAAVKYSKNHNNTQDIYKCNHCDKYHLTRHR